MTGRRGLVLLAALVAVVVGLTAVVVATTRGGAADRRATSGDSAGSAARDRAVRQVLERRARAVLTRDRAGWLADLDPRAREFRAEQETVFDNLAKVRFTSWRYELIGRDYDRPDLASTYDVPYHLPAMLLHYAIKGYDVGPVARPQVLTFVHRGKRWLVASDSDADQDLPETGHADPWDRRPMVVGEGAHVLVLADAQDKGRLPQMVRVADGAVRRVGALWPTGWRRKVVVVAVRDQTLIETYFRTDLQSSKNVAAVAVPAFDEVPGWTPRSSHPYDETAHAGVRSRVILNPRYFDPTDPTNAALLTHEVTHVATQARTRAGAPTWLLEGIAEYTAYRDLRPFSVSLPASLAKQVRAGSVDLPTYDFYQGPVDAHYVAGFLACAFIADRYGEPTLRRFYGQLAGTPREIQTAERTDVVVHRVLHLSPERLSRDVATFAAGVAR